MKTFAALPTLGLLALALQGATLTGTVKFEGKAPQLAAIKMDADPICMTMHKGPAVSEALVLGEGGSLANVFVSIKSGLAAKAYPAPKEPVIVDQLGCHYAPHVIPIMAGQEVEFKNPDGTLHNVHCMSKVNAEFNMAMPKFKKTARKKFDKPETVFAIKCDVHPWMGAWAVVMSHPFFSVSGTDGKYQIKDLPAGDYEVEIWHEKLGVQAAKVTLGKDESKPLDFTMKRAEK